MNRTNTLSAAFSLGLITALGGVSLAEAGGDPRVRVVEFPEESQQYMWVIFSGDGSTASLTSLPGNDVAVHVDRGDGWTLVHRAVGGGLLGQLLSFGVSHDGSVVGFTDYTNASLLEGVATTTVPRAWIGSDGGLDIGRLQGEVLSGDGRHVGVNGTISGEYSSKALVWNGDDQLLNLSSVLPQESIWYRVRDLSNDGSVAVFGSWYYGSLNNIRRFGSDKDVWVWEDGELVMIPQIEADYEVVMRASRISGNGEAVIGTAQGMWYDGFGEDGQLSDEELQYDLIRSPDRSWIWTRAAGTVEIANHDRFERVSVWDITDDGVTVLGSAAELDGGFGHFLWTRNDGFVMVDDLFMKLGISIDADYYSFYQLSSDGSKLMGVSNLDGQYSAITVTIPVKNP